MYHINPLVQLIIVPIIALIITQFIKSLGIMARDAMTFRKAMNVYGGMPSAHTAFVVSLVSQLFLYEGFTGATAVAIVLAAIVIRDAVGFRQLLGDHSAALNHIIEKIHPSKRKMFPHLNESMGHSPTEAFVGGLLGLVISIVATLFL